MSPFKKYNVIDLEPFKKSLFFPFFSLALLITMSHSYRNTSNTFSVLSYINSQYRYLYIIVNSNLFKDEKFNSFNMGFLHPYTDLHDCLSAYFKQKRKKKMQKPINQKSNQIKSNLLLGCINQCNSQIIK